MMPELEMIMRNEILRAQNINKSASGKVVLTNMKLNLFEGEILGLIGLQSAGKTTLANIISGIEQKDGGIIFYDGRAVSFGRRKEAEREGIFAIFESSLLVQNLTIADNLFVINDHSLKKILLNKKIIIDQTKRLAELIDLDIDPRMLAGRVSAGQQYIIRILKAISQDARIIILDNILPSFETNDLDDLYKILAFLKAKDISVIIVTQKLEDIKNIADRIIVMRSGRHIKTLYPDEYGRDYILNLMVGYDFIDKYEKLDLRKGKTVLNLDGVQTKQRLRSVSFCVKASEVVGFISTEKQEIKELIGVLAGFLRAEKGEITINNQSVSFSRPQDAIKNGIGYIPEDAIEKSVMQNLRVIDNLLFMVTKKTSRSFFRVNNNLEDLAFKEMSHLLGIDYNAGGKSMAALSVKQKYLVLYCKWLLVRPALIIMDNPTKSADPVIMQIIYRMVKRFCMEGISVILTSPDIDELLTLCDRVLFLHGGEIMGEFQGGKLSKSSIVEYLDGKHA